MLKCSILRHCRQFYLIPLLQNSVHYGKYITVSKMTRHFCAHSSGFRGQLFSLCELQLSTGQSGWSCSTGSAAVADLISSRVRGPQFNLQGEGRLSGIDQNIFFSMIQQIYIFFPAAWSSNYLFHFHSGMDVFFLGGGF